MRLDLKVDLVVNVGGDEERECEKEGTEARVGGVRTERERDPLSHWPSPECLIFNDPNSRRGRQNNSGLIISKKEAQGEVNYCSCTRSQRLHSAIFKL